jgi:hypothetical protein
MLYPLVSSRKLAETAKGVKYIIPLGNPRPLMCQVGARHVTYIVAFEGDPRPTLLREKYLLPTREPSAEMRLSYDR